MVGARRGRCGRCGRRTGTGGAPPRTPPGMRKAPGGVTRPGARRQKEKGKGKGEPGTRPGIYEGTPGTPAGGPGRDPSRPRDIRRNPRVCGRPRGMRDARLRGLKEKTKEKGKREPESPGYDESPWESRRTLPRAQRHQQCKRRRATLPHPLRCSTIAVQGLSFRVRNGTGRLTLAMVAANLQQITTPPG